ncbi:hypothetical protein EJD97_019984 [Solanum chilense]|uniref:Retrotransposon gag domain-containing protein n=1 Tax=Solanum chilense TaxID=4083 RepID=A0A6N2C6G2_SOLCI|nr:hypothetical protein EJD97_019984 [Solanum chilense]
MSVEEYSLNFTQLSKYALSLMPNPRGDMKSVVWRCSMMIRIYLDYLLYILKLEMILKRGRSNDKGQPRFKKSTPIQDFSSDPKVNDSLFYGYGKKDHKVKDCTTLMDRRRKDNQASLNGPNVDA